MSALTAAKDAVLEAQARFDRIYALPNGEDLPIGTMIRWGKTNLPAEAKVSIKTLRGWLHTGMSSGMHADWDNLVNLWLAPGYAYFEIYVEGKGFVDGTVIR